MKETFKSDDNQQRVRMELWRWVYQTVFQGNRKLAEQHANDALQAFDKAFPLSPQNANTETSDS